MARQREALVTPGHAGRRAGARDQQPGRGGDPRRADALQSRDRGLLDLAAAGWPADGISAEQFSRARRAAAEAAPAGLGRRTRWRSPIARTRWRVAGGARRRARVAGRAAAGRRRGRRRTGASGCRARARRRPSSPDWSGWPAPCRRRAAVDEVKESTRRISDLVAAVKSYSQLDRASRPTHRRHRRSRQHARHARPQAGAGVTVVREYARRSRRSRRTPASSTRSGRI